MLDIIGCFATLKVKAHLTRAFIRTAGVCALATAVACTQAPVAVDTEAFQNRQLPAAYGLVLTALERPARAVPARYRVIVIPGSGCAGMEPIAQRYFAGLLHAHVLVLHKPWVDARSRLPSHQCSAAFVQADALSAWRDHAIAALRADAKNRAGLQVLPQLLVGISEGAELLPTLAPEVPHLAGLVLLSASGLDPQQALLMQAELRGVTADLRALKQAQDSALPDTAVREGRSLRYWRDMSHWSLAESLLASPWPLLQVWGGADALVPQAAYQRFGAMTHQRTAPYCGRSLFNADHGLQRAGHDGVQQLWGWLEKWARAPESGLCAAVAAAG